MLTKEKFDDFLTTVSWNKTTNLFEYPEQCLISNFPLLSFVPIGMLSSYFNDGL